ncbi:hypothetical protein [Blastococcus sp. SYSU DS1024]
MISDARARTPEGGRGSAAPASGADEEPVGGGTAVEAGEPPVAEVLPDDAEATRPEPARRSRRPDREPAAEERRSARASGGARPAVPVVPLLAALLALLLAAAAFLWFTRPEPSVIRTDDYVDALQAARAHVVDLTSFDHVTLDDDLRQIEQVTTEELGAETVAQLEARRQQIVDSEAVVSTEVIGAGITRAGTEDAAALLVIESSQRSSADEQAQLLRYRIEVELTKVDGRWLLSAIRGA